MVVLYRGYRELLRRTANEERGTGNGERVRRQKRRNKTKTKECGAWREWQNGYTRIGSSRHGSRLRDCDPSRTVCVWLCGMLNCLEHRKQRSLCYKTVSCLCTSINLRMCINDQRFSAYTIWWRIVRGSVYRTRGRILWKIDGPQGCVCRKFVLTHQSYTS